MHDDSRSPNDTVWLDPNGAAVHLNTNERFIRKLAQRGDLPHHRLGKRLLRFDRAELDAWLRDDRGDVQ
jgi:excisionase family DNA binding protein